MKRILLIATLFISISSCTDESGASNTLKRHGFTPIKVGGLCWGYGITSGAEGDPVSTHFTAVADNGDTVTGCVTRGHWFKGSTIRLD